MAERFTKHFRFDPQVLRDIEYGVERETVIYVHYSNYMPIMVLLKTANLLVLLKHWDSVQRSKSYHGEKSYVTGLPHKSNKIKNTSWDRCFIISTCLAPYLFVLG